MLSEQDSLKKRQRVNGKLQVTILKIWTFPTLKESCENIYFNYSPIINEWALTAEIVVYCNVKMNSDDLTQMHKKTLSFNDLDYPTQGLRSLENCSMPSVWITTYLFLINLVKIYGQSGITHYQTIILSWKIMIFVL